MGFASTKIQDFKVLGDWRGCWEIGGGVGEEKGFWGRRLESQGLSEGLGGWRECWDMWRG